MAETLGKIYDEGVIKCNFNSYCKKNFYGDHDDFDEAIKSECHNERMVSKKSTNFKKYVVVSVVLLIGSYILFIN